MKTIDYYFTQIINWVGAVFVCVGTWYIFKLVEGMILGNNTEVDTLFFYLCLTLIPYLLLLVENSRFFSFIHTLFHPGRLTYLPLTENEIVELGLESAKDYLFTVVEILNKTTNKKVGLFSFLGVSGVSIYNRNVAEEIKAVLWDFYGISLSTEFWHYLQFVSTKEQLSNLVSNCFQDYSKEYDRSITVFHKTVTTR